MVNVAVSDTEKDDRPPVIVCGVSLASLGPTGQFIACSLSIFAFFIVYGYLQGKG